MTGGMASSATRVYTWVVPPTCLRALAVILLVSALTMCVLALGGLAAILLISVGVTIGIVYAFSRDDRRSTWHT